jgi:fibronectin type 3 domain-containing protein
MKSKKFLVLGMLAMALAFGMVLAGCDTDTGEDTNNSGNTDTGSGSGTDGTGTGTGTDGTGTGGTGTNGTGTDTGTGSTGTDGTGTNGTGTGTGTGGGTTTSKPETPTGVTATADSSTSITITWNAVSGATSYKIYSPGTAGSSSNFVSLDTATTNSYTKSGLKANQTWYYKVSAVNSVGESDQSASVSAKTRSPLNAPTNVVAAHADYPSRPNTSRTSIKITWDAVSGAVSYNVYEHVTYLGGYWEKVGYAVTGTEWTHTGLEPATSHSYIVRAVDSGGTEGADSTALGTAMGKTAP